jgi:hypothetical protein
MRTQRGWERERVLSLTTLQQRVLATLQYLSLIGLDSAATSSSSSSLAFSLSNYIKQLPPLFVHAARTLLCPPLPTRVLPLTQSEAAASFAVSSGLSLAAEAVADLRFCAGLAPEFAMIVHYSNVAWMPSPFALISASDVVEYDCAAARFWRILLEEYSRVVTVMPCVTVHPIDRSVSGQRSFPEHPRRWILRIDNDAPAHVRVCVVLLQRRITQEEDNYIDEVIQDYEAEMKTTS